MGNGVDLTWISHKSSTALRNIGTGAGIVRCATLQGVDPASPAHPLETRTSARPSFARCEFCEISRLRTRSLVFNKFLILSSRRFFQRGFARKSYSRQALRTDDFSVSTFSIHLSGWNNTRFALAGHLSARSVCSPESPGRLIGVGARVIK